MMTIDWRVYGQLPKYLMSVRGHLALWHVFRHVGERADHIRAHVSIVGGICCSGCPEL